MSFQISPQSYTLQWFEYICMELLPTKPNEATTVLLEFRASNYAFLAREFLLNTQIPIVKFQAALVLQYACILRWDSMTAADQHEFRSLIWSLIVPSPPPSQQQQNSPTNTNALPAYAVNKLTQVFALTWKRSWRCEGADSKRQFLGSLYNILITSSKSPGAATDISGLLRVHFTSGAGGISSMSSSSSSCSSSYAASALGGGLTTLCFVSRLLRVVVEEFNLSGNSSSGGSGSGGGGGGGVLSSLAAHRQAHASFEVGFANGSNGCTALVADILQGLNTDATRFTPAAVLGGLDDCFVIGINTVTASIFHFGSCFGLIGAHLYHAHGGDSAAVALGLGTPGSSGPIPPVTADVLLSPEFLRVCVNVKESFKLLIECLSWDFGGSGSGSGSGSANSKAGGNNSEEKRSYAIPSAWRPHVFTAALVAGITRTYEGMRLLYLYCTLRSQQQQQQQEINTNSAAVPTSAAQQSLLMELRCAMLEVRNLMLVYVSTTQSPSHQQQQRLEEGSAVLEALVVPLFERLADPLLFFSSTNSSSPAADHVGDATGASQTVTTAILTALIAAGNAATATVATNHAYADSSAGVAVAAAAATRSVQRPIYQQLRTDEYEYCCTAVSRCLHNYRMGLLVQMPVFTSQVLLLLGKNTFVLSGELAGMAGRRLELQHQQHQHHQHSRQQGAGFCRELLAATLVPELIGESQGQQNSSGVDLFSDQGAIFDGELLHTPTYVVDSWRGEVLSQLLDLWCALLENPLMLCYPHILCPDGDYSSSGSGNTISAHAAVSAALKLQLKDMSGVVFRNLFRCMLLASVSQQNGGLGSAGDDEEEEEEEEEGIQQTSLEAMISNICVIGRYQYGVSVALVLGQLGRSVDTLGPLAAAGNMQHQSQPQPHDAAVIRVTEIVLGVSVRFATQLCSYSLDSSDADCDTSMPSTVTAVAGQYDALLTVVDSHYSEQPDISYLVLDSYLYDCDPAHNNNSSGNADRIPQLHLRLVNQIMPALLQCQHALMHQEHQLQEQQQSGAAVPAQRMLYYSPLLLQHVFSFYDHYITTFLQNESPSAAVQGMYNMHWGSADTGSVLESLLQCVYAVTMGQWGEQQLVRAGYEALAAVAKVPRCREFLLQSPAYSMIVSLVLQYKPTAVSKSHLSRLPVETLRLVVHTVGQSLLRIGNTAAFADCCSVLISVTEFCYAHSCGATAATAAAGGANPPLRPALIRDVQTCTVMCLGLVRCQCSSSSGRSSSSGGSGSGSGSGNVLHQLLEMTSSRVGAIIAAYYAQHHAVDDLIMFYCILLCEYAEYQLGTLGAAHTASLYTTVYRFYSVLDTRLRSTALFANNDNSTGGSTGPTDITSTNGLNTKATLTGSASILSSAEAAYEFELFKVLLTLLNRLGTKDFCLDDDDEGGEKGANQGAISPQALEHVLVCTLFAGLHLALTRTSPTLLAHHPALAERYFSLIQYLSNAYEKQFLGYLGVIPVNASTEDIGTGATLLMTMPSIPPGSSPLLHLQRVAQQLLWCIGSSSTDLVSSRLILSIIYNIAANYWNHLSTLITKLGRLHQQQQGQQQQQLLTSTDETRLQYLGTHNDDINALLFSILEHLFRIVTLPPTAPLGLFSPSGAGGLPVTATVYPEQLDSYGSTLFALLVYIHTASTLPKYYPQLRATHSIQSFIASASRLLIDYASAANNNSNNNNNNNSSSGGSGSGSGSGSTNDAELLQHFQALLTDRNLDCTNMNNRVQRNAFCANLKTYVSKVKPLLLYK